MERLKIKIIIPTYQSANTLLNTLGSIANQYYRNYEVFVVDDASPDNRCRQFIKEFCDKKQRFTYQFNETNVGSLANIIEGCRVLDCREEEVVLIVDGDDWLAHPSVLDRIVFEYQMYEIFFTYGQYMILPWRVLGPEGTLLKSVIENNSYRKVKWVFGHPRTFKYGLWKKIKDGDLRDPRTGEYWKVTGDAAWIFPLLELSRGCFKHIPDILYVYNRGNPLCDGEIRPLEQKVAADYIRSIPPYQTNS